jgi:hypothetical protein
MTPKEKAKELYLKYYDFIISPFTKHNCTKQCALIAVDELIYETQFEVPNIRQKYWINVKQEINEL